MCQRDARLTWLILGFTDWDTPRNNWSLERFDWARQWVQIASEWEALGTAKNISTGYCTCQRVYPESQKSMSNNGLTNLEETFWVTEVANQTFLKSHWRLKGNNQETDWPSRRFWNQFSTRNSSISIWFLRKLHKYCKRSTRNKREEVGKCNLAWSNLACDNLARCNHARGSLKCSSTGRVIYSKSSWKCWRD